MKVGEEDWLKLPTAQRLEAVEKWLASFAPQPIRRVVYLVMYDITDDKVRRYVADFLLREGLTRVQKSVFLGKSPVRRFRELASALKDINEMYANYDSIFVLPVPEEKVSGMRVIGRDLDVRMVLYRPNVLVI